jgi:Ca-activated chloride channel family protein
MLIVILSRSSAFIRNATWNDLLLLAETSSVADNLLQKNFVSLVHQAKTLYTKTKKKKGDRLER